MLIQFVYKFYAKIFLLFSIFICSTESNPDAKRLYDDLLSNYNRLIRPVSNNTDTILVKLGLRLSQLIELVSASNKLPFDYFKLHKNGMQS